MQMRQKPEKIRLLAGFQLVTDNRCIRICGMNAVDHTVRNKASSQLSPGGLRSQCGCAVFLYLKGAFRCFREDRPGQNGCRFCLCALFRIPATWMCSAKRSGRAPYMARAVLMPLQEKSACVRRKRTEPGSGEKNGYFRRACLCQIIPCRTIAAKPPAHHPG